MPKVFAIFLPLGVTLAGRTRVSAIACLALGLAASAPVVAAELNDQTLRAYSEYIGRVRARFEERVGAGDSLSGIERAGVPESVREGLVLVQPAREDGIVRVPGGLMHHWKGVAFIPDVTLQEAVTVSQDYANYNHVYGPIIDGRTITREGDSFHVLMRIQKSGGPVSAVVDVWSRVRYQWRSRNLVYSASDSECITEVRNAGKRDERRLAPDQGKGYLWRAHIYSRFEELGGGVLVELENVGLSRAFPPMLGWIIEPIARRIGKGSIEDSLVEFRSAVLAYHARPPDESSSSPATTNPHAPCGTQDSRPPRVMRLLPTDTLQMGL